ncbi:MAG: vitamin K epoxide reductase family protein [Candidatus Taylorbacteria bacterium]|nr:vitamin K epoxide reductase family protein [Candidatus Taylorbacteria bacterium]
MVLTFPVLLILLSAVGGFSLATFIHFKKKKSAPIVCPIGHSCDPVVHSDYSCFLCIPVELFGMLYYFVIICSYILLSLYPEYKEGWTETFIQSVSGIAFVFSLYLTAVQAFVLKKWCTWCLISATLCTIIFFFGLSL